MSATMTAPEQIDGLEKLITLASLRKEDIIATQEEVRRQLQLTQAEQGKLAEAKSYITKYTSLVTNLQGREDTLAANAAILERDKTEFATHVATENTRLENFAASLTSREDEVKKSEQRNISEAQSLVGQRAEQNRQYQDAMNNLRAAEISNSTDKQANEAEKQRLKEWENTLKAKAQRIKTEAASL